MAPNLVSTTASEVLYNQHSSNIASNRGNSKGANDDKSKEHKMKIVWRNVILFVYLHLAALYGLYLSLMSAKLYTTMLAYVLYIMGGLGITAGAHRLWAHKSYSAKLPLKIILMIFNSLAFQNSIYEWARDHRVHHKYSETDADPHNAKKGIFFSHIGWLLVKKHPDVISKGKNIDLSDLENDPVVAFQRKYYKRLMVLICFVIPTCIPVYCWGETWSNSFFVATLLRYTVTLNVTWFVNSIAHFIGSKPYDSTMNPVQNLFVSIGALGEGWHNYHHVFPWDYKTAELGNYSTNFTTAFIDFMAKIGWAYDMKTVSPEMIMKRAKRTGDEDGGDVWGWDDKDMKAEDRETALVIGQSKEVKTN
ncbi:UNVERIFIED_CONTAM: hypothetical protein PYX00_002834 [Menopon gallinae]|uniref:Fatty acid desaturase domain-containing protein n=1 Tax=Menopon gallinae TaxID=328185 RepID=A0AAW2HZT5_9NEOP